MKQLATTALAAVAVALAVRALDALDRRIDALEDAMGDLGTLVHETATAPPPKLWK